MIAPLCQNPDSLAPANRPHAVAPHRAEKPRRNGNPYVHSRGQPQPAPNPEDDTGILPEVVTNPPPATRTVANPSPSLPTPIAILGVPFDNVTTPDTLRLIGRMIESRHPHYAATANVDFVVQALNDVELRRILTDADLVLCDGMPLVWASRFLGNPLPERVTGSDLVPELLAEAERKAWRVFFLGGTPSSLNRAADRVRSEHPQLQLVGTYSPPFKPLLEMDQDDILQRIRLARPDLLLVAFGCPKQEKWINMHLREANVPFSIGVGATIDFLAGSVRRAPRWMQRIGLEWVFRLLQEPRRLFRRYCTDLWVFGRAILRQWWQLQTWRQDRRRPAPVLTHSTRNGIFHVVHLAGRLDAATAAEYAALWPDLAGSGAHVVWDMSRVTFLDSTGVGLLVRLNKHLQARSRQLVLVSPSPTVRRALSLMRVGELFSTAPDLSAAYALTEARRSELPVVVTLHLGGLQEPVAWQGEITAANAEEVWRMTRMHIEFTRGRQSELGINLAAVRFIDSTGVRLMLRARKEARLRGIQLKFTEPAPAVRNVLRILRLEHCLLN